jgi:hypothetical protein
MTIHPFALQRYPARAQVAFFKDVAANADGRGVVDGRSMDRSPVAKQYLIGDAMPTPLLVQEIAQARQVAAVVPRRPRTPVKQITGMKLIL